MAFKFIAVCALFSIANAGYLAPATYAPGPVTHGVAFSPAPAVSHFSYTSPVVSYGQPFAAQTPAITSQSSNILRSYGNLGQVSTYSKTIDTPYSSVRKSDVRVSNPGYATAYAAPVVHAAPVAHATYAAPAFVKQITPVYTAPAPLVKTVAPAVVKAPVAAAPLLGVAYSAAPVVSHMTYTSGLINYGW